MPITSPGNDDDTGENHQPTLRKNTAEPVEQTLKQNIPELGEYLESVDGTGICKLTELDGGGEEVVVCLPDGTMPEGISDLELVRVPTRIEEGDAKTETMSDETAERMARTRFIVDEYTMGVLDEQEAGERLFRHLFPHWG